MTGLPDADGPPDPAADLRAGHHEIHAAASASGFVRSVELLPLVGSTQDEAFARCGGAAGLLVLAGRQTKARGRLGRVWHDAGLGVSASFVLDAGRQDPRELPLRAGVAAASACDAILPAPGCGLRWPNDVMEPARGPTAARKLAGVLIEQRGGLLVLGIGIDVLQGEPDFPDHLRGRAVSVRMLGSPTGRAGAAARLIGELARWLAEPLPGVVAAWLARDTIRGTRRVFEHDGVRVEGVVESIDPTSEISVRTRSGALVRLPAATTSLVHDEA